MTLMPTIHDQIDELLAADVHDQLSTEERHALHHHLVECADCRKLHQETKLMNRILEENLSTENADPNFERRMLAGFRSKVPNRPGLLSLLTSVMRLRATQIAAAAALLLALIQVGRMVTREGFPETYGKEAKRLVVTGSNMPTDDEQGAAGPALPLSAAAPMAALAKSAKRQTDFTTGVRYRSLEAGLRPDPNTADHYAFSGGLKAKTPGEANDIAGRDKDAIASFAKQDAPAPAASESAETPAPSPQDGRKLIRNAQVELEIVSFDDAFQRITEFAREEKGYVATSGSQKQANGKLRGQVVVKVLPQNLDHFLQSIRGLGELKNQTLGTDDVTKAYFDTEARLKNARTMEQRLIDMLKTKTGKVSDLLEVERELSRVREEIEKMQGELKYWDSQVQFATVTISLAEKDMNVPAAFLLKERAQLALYASDVEKTYNDIKAVASPRVQITNAQLEHDNAGRVSARISMLIAPEESDTVIERVKAMGRVANFQVQTDRVAQGGEGMGENAKTERDKVQLNITISRDQQEQAFQQTTLRIRTGAVDERTKELRALAEKQGGRVRSSSFSRDPDGREYANVSLRVPMKNYNALMQSLDSLGKLENVAVQRQDQTGGQIDEANAPADISVQVYSQGNVVSQQSGLLATLRRTVAQGASALMWSVRMIGVALAFFAPWVIALAVVIWVVRRIRRARGNR